MLPTIAIVALLLAGVLYADATGPGVTEVPPGANVGHATRALSEFGCHANHSLTREHLDNRIEIHCAPTASGERARMEIASHWSLPTGILLAVVHRPGGSGAWAHLAWVTESNVERLPLGDRTTNIALHGDPTTETLHATMTVHGEGDPRCCPTRAVQRTVRIAGTRIELGPITDVRDE